MRKWKTAAILSVSLPALLILAGCGTGTGASAGKPLVLSINHNPDNLTPGLGSLAADDGPEGLLNAPLIYLDQNDKWQPDLATKWTESKDGLTYTFTLNPKAKWSDGSAITPQDVVYTWHYYTNKNIHFTYVTGWDKVKDVKAIGSNQVQFTLSSPYAPFLSTVASSYVVPQKTFSKWTPDQINHGQYDSSPIGDGPYILKKWTPDQELDFAPNPYWFGPKVKIQNIVYRIIPDSTTAFNELKAGNLTVGTIPAEDINQAKSLNSQFNLITPLGATYNQVTPIEHGFLKDVKVRQALDYATPRSKIVTDIMHGMAVPAADDQVPGGYWNDPNVNPRPFDLQKAAALLAADGFTKGAGGFLYKGGKKFEVPIWTGSTSHNNILIAQVISQAWESIGVDAPVKTADWSFIFGQKGPQFNGKMEALLFSWGQGVFPDDTIDFNSKYIITSATSPGENAERYSNSEMDKLTVEGTTLSSKPARQQVYYKIQQLEHDTVPIIFLYWTKSEVAVSKNLHGYQQTVFGTTPVWDWSLS